MLLRKVKVRKNERSCVFFVALIISSIVAPTIAGATTQGQEIYDGQDYHIEQVGDSIIIKDKSTGETATTEMIYFSCNKS